MARPEVDRPVFILGPHRSGTTLLYRILAKHPDLGFLNQGNRRYPGSLRLAHLLTRAGLVENQPKECRKVWDRFPPVGDDRMDASQAPPPVRAWFRATIAKVLELQARPRFLAKYPRLSLRTGWLDAVFPDAFFLHLVRDWRAVVGSTVLRRRLRESQEEKGRWFGVRIPGWREMEQDAYELVAGRQYRVVTEHLEAASRTFGDRFLRVAYDGLCLDPVGTLRRIAGHCALRWTAGFETILPAPGAPKERWSRVLGPAWIERIRAEAPSFYARYEAPPGPELG